MAKVELRRPFFVVNPKSYLYGKELIDLAKCADELAIKYDVDILFTAPLIDLKDLIAYFMNLFGNNVNLNWIDVSDITDMSYLFEETEFNGTYLS